MLKWGTELADLLMLPAYVEASDAGHHAYKQNGFEDIELSDRTIGRFHFRYFFMKRPHKVNKMMMDEKTRELLKE